jgi:hypothetical protein
MPTVSPELALVDPALRSAAIAGLPDVRPFAFLEHATAPVAALAVPARDAIPSRAFAAGAYLLIAVARMCAVNAAIFAGIAALVFVINLFA